MSLLGKEGGAWVDVLGSKVLLDVGVRVWRQQIRGVAVSLSKAQQDQESETLAPKTEVKSWTQRLATRSEGVFSDSGGVFVSPPMFRLFPEVLRWMLRVLPLKRL